MSIFEYILITYFTAISLMAVFLTICDKQSAIHKKRRIPEKELITVGVFGGALPMFLTMKIIRHKTHHNKFMIGLPIIFFLQISIILIILLKKY
ncbi:MAG: DUF1294 domain-containing protein [Oscillospiraceae bacterium]